MLVWKSFGIQHVAACLAENRERFNICCENLVLDQIGVFSLPVFWWYMDIIGTKKKRVKPLYRPKWPMGLVLNSSFISMKRPGVLLLPPGWDASPSQGYPQHICWYPFVHLGEEKHCESKVSCLRTQHNDQGQGSNPDYLIHSRAHKPSGHHTSTIIIGRSYMFITQVEVKGLI